MQSPLRSYQHLFRVLCFGDKKAFLFSELCVNEHVYLVEYALSRDATT